MSAYTLLQLLEVLVFSVILLLGVLGRSSSVTILGGGLLMAKAILNILWPEGGTVYRRSLIGYGIAGVFVLGGLIASHFAG
ncbi:MAG TPA: hypothetical protein VEN12_08775 [Verrucomicrobiae bacterium]|nr:hypothetical protein [Verrucomicrobiae bacterium]